MDFISKREKKYENLCNVNVNNIPNLQVGRSGPCGAWVVRQVKLGEWEESDKTDNTATITCLNDNT